MINVKITKLTCHAMRSMLRVRRRVRAPRRAAASAASQPACPPPTTMTSYCSSIALELSFPPVHYDKGASCRGIQTTDFQSMRNS